MTKLFRRNLKFILVFIFLIILVFPLLNSLRKVHPAQLTKNFEDIELDFYSHLTPFMAKGIPGNFEEKEKMELLVGPGENGEPFLIENESLSQMDIYGMNIGVSDAISTNRSIPDTRMPECKFWHYPKDLPKTSVVIVFHNEGLSVLLRTISSIINRTPESILEEILLVDDYSSMTNLGAELSNYIQRFNTKVRLIRNGRRQGLIRSRNRGALEARGIVIVFLDAHCEVNVNWLPPLLAPIYKNHSTMTVPIIDGIDSNDFNYKSVYSSSSHFRGIFEWGLLYKESEVPDEVLKTRAHDSEPYASPTHAGGLFAIDRHYFLSLGLYDEGLLVWGGENFELSFKIWQCGGSILWVPCSHVGHVYRNFMPYDFGDLIEGHRGPLITSNYKRVIEVWMDEKYKKYFYTREPLAQYIKLGDISKQLYLKTKLKCKSFQWFLTNVATEMQIEYPNLPENDYWGKLKNYNDGCLSTGGQSAPSSLVVEPCFSNENENQIFRLNQKGQMSNGERCLDVSRQKIQLVFCASGSVSGNWKYNEESSQLKNIKYQKCLETSLRLSKCDTYSSSQKWSFEKVIPNWS